MPDTTILFVDSLAGPGILSDTLPDINSLDSLQRSDSLALNAITLQDTLRQSDSLITPEIPHKNTVPPEALYGKSTVLESPANKVFYSKERDMEQGLAEGFLSLGVIFLLLLFFRYVRNFFSRLTIALFNFRFLEKQFVEKSAATLVTGRVLTFFAILSISFFVWLLLLHNAFLEDELLTPWHYFLIIFALLAIFFLSKFIILHIINYVSKSAPVMPLIIYAGRLCIIACGFLLLPISLLGVTSGQGEFFTGLMTIGGIVVILCLILYLAKIIQIFFITRVSSFFLILYLCTFEVVPFVLLHSFVSLS